MSTESEQEGINKPVLTRKPADWDVMTEEEKERWANQVLDQMGVPDE